MTRILPRLITTIAALALLSAFMSSPVSAQSSKVKKGQQSQSSKVFPHPVRGSALSDSGGGTAQKPPKNRSIDLKATSLYGLAN
jgi:hypothetical protein